MTTDISSAAVIGAGVMGRGIAAVFARAGVPVLLLDLPTEGVRNGLAERALKALTDGKDPVLDDSAARLIVPGNLEDDLARLGASDWIVEAVVEEPAVKARLFETLDPLRKPTAVISTNTSTLRLKSLTAGRSPSFRSHFLATHFFNPPHRMRLVEVAPGVETAPEVLAAVQDISAGRLGKAMVACRDTPGFVANRIGVFWIQAALAMATARSLPLDAVDAAVSRAFTAPRTGVFGLLDLIGLDTMALVAESFRAQLPEDDAMQAFLALPTAVAERIAEGFTGRKGKGGFYRSVGNGAVEERQVFDFGLGGYRPVREPSAAVRMALDDFIADHRRAVFDYVHNVANDITDDPRNIDLAMTLGYNWKKGPIALMAEEGASALTGIGGVAT